MADLTKTVDLIFNAIDKTGAATDAALNNAQKFSTSVQNVTGPVADATTAALKFEAALAASGLALTAYAIKVAGDFDTAFREIATLINQPIDDLDEFKQAIQDYASTSTQPLEQITQAIYSAISAGVDYGDAIDAVSTAEKLAVASKADLNATTVTLISSLNAYGKGMEDAEDFSDALFTTVKLGQTNMTELSGSLSQVTSIAAAAGVPFEDLLAAVAALTAQGMPTAEAMTALKGVLSAIIAPSQQAAAAAKELGLDLSVSALEAKGLDGVLRDVAEATGGSVEKTAELFGNIRGLTGVLALGSEEGRAFAATMEAMDQRAGATAEAYAKMAASFVLANKQIFNSLKGILINIGMPLLDEYDGIAKAIAEIFRGIGVSVKSGDLADLNSYVESVFADVEATLRQVAENLPKALEQADLSSFTEGLDVVLEAIKSLFDGVDLTSTEGLVSSIETLGKAFLGLGNFTAGAIESFKPALDLLLSFANGVEKSDTSMLGFLGTLGGAAIQLDKVLPAVDTLLLLLIASRGGGLAAAATTVTASVTTLLPLLGKAGLVGAAGAAGYAVGTVLNYAINAVVGSLSGGNSLGTLIYELVNDTEEVEEVFISAARGIREMDSAATETAAVVRDFDQEVNDMAAAADAAAAETGSLARAFADAGYEIDPVTGKVRTFEEAAVDAAVATQRAEESANGWRMELVEGVATYTQVGSVGSKAMDGIASSTAKSEKELEKATDRAHEFEMKMLELSSNERIKAMEFSFDLKVAQTEADTKRIEAAFASLDVAIQSTGETTASLFDTLSGFDGGIREQLLLENEIRRESDRRDEAMELQKALIEAQITEMEARAKSMERGDGMIKIDGAGLQPHLEGFMWEILRAIQVRVNQDGLGLLMGV